MITLEDKNGNKIRLNDHLIWIDEDQHSTIAQNQEFGVTGALIVETSKKKAGRPITLSAEPREGVKYRKDALEIQAFFDKTIFEPMVLTVHDGRKFAVVWRATDAPPFSYPPLFNYADPHPEDYVGLTIRLTEI